MVPRRLYDLDRSSTQFPDRFYRLLDDEYVERLANLPEDELAGAINYLNDILGDLDRTGQSFRKCFQVLRKLCGCRATLPASYQVPGPLSSIGETPDAFGGFCDVYKGKLDTGVDICIKKIRMYTSGDVDKVKQSFHREAVIWNHLRHPHIVPFLGVTLEPLQLVSEWMPGGDLREYVRKNPGADRISLLHGVAEGLAYLHSSNVIHGDIRGPNIMIDGSGKARITDFGLTVIAQDLLSHESTLDEDGHTGRWCAPEILRSEQTVSKASDVFSFGMVIIEVFTAKAPFSGVGTPAAMAKIMTEKLPERPTHPGFTDRLWELTRRCLKPVPSDRPHVEEVVEALKDMAESRRASLDEVDDRRSLAPKDETKEPFFRRAVRNSLLKRQQEADTKPHRSGPRQVGGQQDTCAEPSGQEPTQSSAPPKAAQPQGVASLA